MRKHLIMVAPLLLLWGCNGKKRNSSFELKGELSNTNNETLYLEKLASAQPQVVDSAEIDDEGKFEFKNHTPAIGFYRIKHNNQNFVMLVLDSTDKVKVTGNLADLGNSYKVEGSPESALFNEYSRIGRQRDMRLDSINNIAQTMMEPNRNDQKKMEELTARFEGPYNNIIESSNRQFAEKILANTDKYASIMAIQALEPDKYANVYKALDAGLSKKFPSDTGIKMFHMSVARLLSTAVGQEAPDIRMPSPEGKEISLSDFRGKVVLIDFWASWCGPCRREMPSVVAAYKEYKDKGFEIFGVSLDQDKGRWVEAIAADHITWPQVSDLKHWQSAAAKLYNVQSIPYTVLLDREGKIVAKNLRGKDLEKKLAEVLNISNKAVTNALN
jgi:peroxiredoxin